MSAETSLPPGSDHFSVAAETWPATRVTVGDRTAIEELVIREFPLTIYLNGEEIVTLLCTPVDMDYLAVGFLQSEGLVGSREAIKKVVIDEKKGAAWVETSEGRPPAKDLMFRRLVPSGCGRGAIFYHPVDSASQEKVASDLRVEPRQVLSLMAAFQRRSELYRATGGVHSAALCDPDRIVVHAEDIARHNAIDRIFGRCLMNAIPTAGRIIATSGRISSEILLKVARRQVPVVVSKSAPTTLALRTAEELAVTVIGYARGQRMNVYTHPWRVGG